jgi:transposase
MYATATVTLNRDEMEQRRLEAAEELLRGTTQARVARQFGVSRTTASRWNRALAGHSVERLRKRKAPGRPSRLTSSQQAEVIEIFALGPRAFGFETDHWSTARLAHAIHTRFGIRYDPDHVGRLMHRLGLRGKPAPMAKVLLEEPAAPAYTAPADFTMQM